MSIVSSRIQKSLVEDTCLGIGHKVLYAPSSVLYATLSIIPPPVLALAIVPGCGVLCIRTNRRAWTEHF